MNEQPEPSHPAKPRDLTLAEIETIVRWDRSEDRIFWSTLDVREAHRWQSKGYDVEVRDGGWRMETPKGALTLKRRSAVNRKLTHAGQFGRRNTANEEVA